MSDDAHQGLRAKPQFGFLAARGPSACVSVFLEILETKIVSLNAAHGKRRKNRKEETGIREVKGDDFTDLERAAVLCEGH